MAQQQPIAVNLCSYVAGMHTPTGEWIKVRPGQAVAGPGFEKQIKDGVLTVSPDFKGKIVYETPAALKVAKSKPTVKAPPPEPVVPAEDLEMKASNPPPEPEFQKAPPREPSPGDQRQITRKDDDKIEVPSMTQLKKLSRASLSNLAERLGKDSDGSKSKLVARLSPLAGQTVKEAPADEKE